MSSTNFAVGASLPRPLCAKYLLVLLEDLWTTEGRASCLRRRTLRWGLGVSSAGEQEFLGVWRTPEATGTEWHAIAGDLKIRGVDSIQVATGSDATGIEAAIRVYYPRAVVLTEQDIQAPPVDDDISGCPPVGARQRRILASASDRMRGARLGMQRAWDRYKKPKDSDSASTFVASYIDKVTSRPGRNGGDWSLGRTRSTSDAMVSSDHTIFRD